MSTPSLKEATEALDKAAEVYNAASFEAAAASARQTTALNALNAAQRAFDATVAAVRKERGPRDSDWGRPPSLPAP